MPGGPASAGRNGQGLATPGEVRWLIAPGAGLLLSATPAGATRLGVLSPTQTNPVPLDKSMPALAVLAALAASDALDGGAIAVRDLVLWTARGPLTLRCACRRPDAADGPSRGNRDVVLVSPVAVDTAGGTPPPVDTGLTLSRIAERIRAGLRVRAGSTVTAPVAPSVALTDPSPSPSADAAADPSAEHLAKLAHELRTPLAAIAAMAEIMRDERFGPLADARYRDYAGSMHDSARHMLAVIETMLDRSASGETHGDATRAQTATLTFVDLDLNALAAAAAESIRPLAAEAGLALDIRLADRLPMVVADRRCVRQILLNLLANALKFTPAGGRVSVATRYDADGRVRLEVADTGRGMSAEDCAVASGARPASAATTGSRRYGGGHGLGLPLVHALAAANGAGVVIASTPGEGTRVAVIFQADRVVPV